MNSEFHEFIGVWDNAMPRDVCQEFIDQFEKLNLEGQASFRFGDKEYGGKHRRKDMALFVNYNCPKLTSKCNQYLQNALNEYLEEYSHLSTSRLISTEVKMQKTEECGGYHVWHWEDQGFSVAQRVLTWIIYLNDVEEGQGETEFLYQKKRVSPKAGRIVIWPAGFTHLHRGNPVFNGAKYILTGWYINVPEV